MIYHDPVLLNESIDGLNIKPGGIYVDVTFGGGGHSTEILHQLEGGRLIAFDQDADAQANKLPDERFTLVHHNFKFLRNFLKYHNAEQVDGILADFGVSWHQFDEPERGFSFRGNAPLDMRMNRKALKTAATVINTFSETQLADMLFLYGELQNSRKLANLIVKSRANNPINTVEQLVEAVKYCIPRAAEHKFLAQIFQAIRIEVNNEMQALKDFLEQALYCLKPGGRLSVITYHSLEDRLVKNYVKAGNFEGKQDKDFYGNVSSPWKTINKNVIIPSKEEIERNNRARSAKLRIAEKG